MPAPCKQCGFVGSAEEMKQHTFDAHGGDRRHLNIPRVSRHQTIALAPTKTKAEADATNINVQSANSVLRGRMGKGSTPYKMQGGIPKKK